MRRISLIIGILFIGALVLAPAAGAVSDAIVCDEYHNGGGMDADCANHIFFMMEVGQLGEL